MGHGPYVKLVTGFLFTSLAFMVRIDHCFILLFFFWLVESAPPYDTITGLVNFVLRDVILFDACELGPGCAAAAALV